MHPLGISRATEAKQGGYRVALGRRPLAHCRWLPRVFQTLQLQELLIMGLIASIVIVFPVVAHIPYLTVNGCAKHKKLEDCMHLTYRIKKYFEHIGAIGHSLLACMFLPIARNSVLVRFTGLSYDRLLKWHRMAGRVLYVIVLLHGGGFFLDWLVNGVFLSKLTNLHILAGIVCLSCLTVLNIFSLETYRQSDYRLFRWVHIILVPLVIGLLALHYAFKKLVIKTGIPIALYILDLLLRRMYVRECEIQHVRTIGSDVVRVELKTKHALAAEDVVNCKWVYVSVPALSLFEIHPFSLCNLKASEIGIVPSADNTLVFYAKSTRSARKTGKVSWTNNLFERGESLRREKIYVDGPYGGIGLKFPIDAYESLCIAAGGIGVTPFLPLLVSLSRHEDIPGVTFLWVCNNRALIDEFAEVLHMCGANENIIIMVHYTGQDDSDDLKDKLHPNAEFALGRPYMGDIFASAKDKAGDFGVIGCLVCGPQGFCRAVTAEAACCRVPVHIHQETYQV